MSLTFKPENLWIQDTGVENLLTFMFFFLLKLIKFYTNPFSDYSSIATIIIRLIM